MADFNKPTVDSYYTQFPNEIRAAISAALSFLDGGSHTNIPMKAKRWNSANKIFEEYSGTQWVPMATEYKLPVDYNVLLNKPVPSSSTNSESKTTFASSKAVKDAYDLANEKQSPATTLSGYGITDFVVKDLTTEDLNNVTTPGFYSQRLTARAERNKNYPLTEAGSLVVKPSAYVLMQEYTTHKTKRIYIRNRTDFSGAWSEWKLVTSDGLPVGSIVSFPKNITPAGFLKANGTTFNQNTYPDLYTVNGNSNVLPNLTRSDVGMTAYFPIDQIPSGWIAFDLIRTTVTQGNYPELYTHLVTKYGSIAQVPLAEDRFIRNAGNGLSVGETQDDAIRNITGQFTIDDYDRDKITGVFKMIGNGHAAGNSGGGTLVEFNASLVVPTADENRPKSIILKLCIKAKNAFDDVVFWVKAFGDVVNTGILDAGTLSQDLQQLRSKTQQLEQSFNQTKSETDSRIKIIENKLNTEKASNIVWSGNVTQNSANVLELSESILNKTLIFYLQVSQGHSLQQNVDTNTMSVFVDEKLLEVNGRKYIHFVFYFGGWKSVQIEIIEDRKIKIIEASNMYIKQITAI
ncbi:tail fiber protein [Pasteurella multocida]|uniref:tail fiber protein n=1 Tax=Pasteurella multocida TaxID=747 RepID=UPI002D1EB5D1|nr:tail fiber protein [Pasteurella multocida]MEB4494300.1 tail fiber protein [Pasteurella multocida]MEB4502018.1 tail fiber protein [Pasteurella multocida]MEB4511729.1 tail fiber protein [Pasteurella multocida]MEB4532241.1 tail fiber protein [Pasteurella multocida]MEB4536490.1 tail fiber protein [Pasteurella multocida]